jgi:2-phosphosulfolactate phosphatase
MKINILYGIEGAKEAEGITVIVDVFRAATTAAYIFAGRAKYIIPVTRKEEAFRIKEENPSYILIGEENCIKIKGFDYGNSPSQLVKANLKDKIIVQRTTNGVPGIINAEKAGEIIFGTFCIASAIRDYIISSSYKTVSIVAMDGPDTEDELFANYLKELITGGKPEIKPIIDYLNNNESVKTRCANTLIPEFKEDVKLCLKVDTFDFISIIEKNKKFIIIKKKI